MEISPFTLKYIINVYNRLLRTKYKGSPAVYMYECVCMYVCCMYVRLYVYVCVCLYYVCVCVYVRMYVKMCVCMYLLFYLFIKHAPLHCVILHAMLSLISVLFVL